MGRTEGLPPLCITNVPAAEIAPLSSNIPSKGETDEIVVRLGGSQLKDTSRR